MFFKTAVFVVAGLVAATDAVNIPGRGRNTHRPSSRVHKPASSNFHHQAPFSLADKEQQPDSLFSSNECQYYIYLDTINRHVLTEQDSTATLSFSVNLTVSELCHPDETLLGSALQLVDAETDQIVERVHFTIWRVSDGDDDEVEEFYEHDDVDVYEYGDDYPEDNRNPEFLGGDDDDPGDL
ncbi:hypothetical protein HRG_001235 [Hirsutella rhossiliensis]|uniref:Uncharacterized protein n=1 Tax=Hirsutella rhossiliensis TaxID=111463 RepID=A0A9P8N6L9_9HYPO|nr:uncharacterized protein HRG_01235 [Hirsutella rhossiliensis]KAH0968593.1 hypothetical protein HRG_01235 [Hirsutella rhossiliensis]